MVIDRDTMSKSSNRALHILVFLDGRPGHEKQTLGIVAAIEKMADVTITKIRVSQNSFIQRVVATCRYLLGVSPSFPPESKKADLLIGTGSTTHPVMLSYKRVLKIPALTCMTPNFYYKKGFDICFVPAHDEQGGQANIIETLGAPNCSVDRKSHQIDKGLILLGGVDENSHRWDSNKIVQMVKNIVNQNRDTNWTISSSPRTPKETTDLISELVDKSDNADFFAFEDTPRGWVETEYDKSSTVWVTSDSVSMIYEALSAGCNVGLLPVEWKKKTSKFKKNEDILVGKNQVTSYKSWLQDKTLQEKNVALNEAQRCAEYILDTWWPTN